MMEHSLDMSQNETDNHFSLCIRILKVVNVCGDSIQFGGREKKRDSVCVCVPLFLYARLSLGNNSDL